MPSELPVLARAQYHWIVLFRRPHTVLLIALLVSLVAAIFAPNPMAWIFLIVLCGAGYLRWQSWRAEWVILTRRRLIRVRGIPETTTSEASLRLDRISGVVLVQTVFGKILNYGSIELEAPGQHPDVRNLVNIARPNPFYLEVRRVVFGGGPGPEDGGIQEYTTAPLPF
ncbi:MAG: PH domain-containing protein [Actinomycetota bacterium]|nr:PH domain-containing protein [Actinomycetota bacterium]